MATIFDVICEQHEKKEVFKNKIVEKQHTSRFPVRNCLIKEGKTTPPKHYTEDSLLSAMENAADVSADVERKGIGTPATRAGIIEKLVQKGYKQSESVNLWVLLQQVDIVIA